MVQHWKALTVKIVMLITMISTLSACGFHLRGAQEVADDKRAVTLITNSADLILLHTLQQNMELNGIHESANAPYKLKIIKHQYDRRAATLRSNADVDEYEISVKVTMLVTDREGNPLTADIPIQGERIYSYDKNAAAASSELESLLKQELYESVAQAIIRRYLAANTPK